MPQLIKNKLFKLGVCVYKVAKATLCENSGLYAAGLKRRINTEANSSKTATIKQFLPDTCDYAHISECCEKGVDLYSRLYVFWYLFSEKKVFRRKKAQILKRWFEATRK